MATDPHGPDRAAGNGCAWQGLSPSTQNGSPAHGPGGLPAPKSDGKAGNAPKK